MLKRERVAVTANEQIGPYTLLRVDRGRLDPGTPGQFFMLEAPGRLLPRPMSLSLAPAGQLAFLVDPIGPGTQALCALTRGDRIGVLGPLGNGFRLDASARQPQQGVRPDRLGAEDVKPLASQARSAPGGTAPPRRARRRSRAPRRLRPRSS